MNLKLNKLNNLDYFFNPKSIAIIGASAKNLSVGKTLIENLKESYKGKIYLINPKRKSILGLKTYPKIEDVKDKIDLVIIATPAKTVPSIVKECSKKKIKAAIIISAGFKELGKPGIELENQIRKNKGDMRIIGPNCLGIINSLNKLNASFAKDMPLKGKLAFISQSGALGCAVLDWSLKEKIGLSSFVSIGSMIDINFSELISYYGKDPNTKAILIYMENIADPLEFLVEASKVTLKKPIILIKAGRSSAGSKAATSHTGAITGNDEVFTAALKRAGILQVNTISELFSIADLISKQPLSNNPNLAIITNAGGPGVIATDSLEINNAFLAKLSKKTYLELNKFLPKAWSHSNPIDILGDASDELYAKTVKVLVKDKNIGGILIILTPQHMTEATKVAKKLKSFSKLNIPIFTSFMGGDSVTIAIEELIKEGIPNFPFPDDATKAFSMMSKYSKDLKKIYQPSNKNKTLINENKKKKASELLKKAFSKNKLLLDEYESKKLIELYDIPIVQTFIAKTKNEAVKYSKKIGFPIVLKIYSKTITHKKKVGGVKLNLKNEIDVKKAFDEIYSNIKKIKKQKEFLGVTVQKMIKLDGYEVIAGSTLDNQFGPVIIFGSGGSLVEIYNDKALTIPPIDKKLAKKMIESTKIYKAIKGLKNNKQALEKLQDILVKLSYLVLDFPVIKEIDINPILISKDKIIALDARVLLNPSHRLKKRL
ncbi:MAG: Succinyl-CoA ligase [ADP-forming] subunit alpha [Candidatus Anoxychlamydiales bacterium]|nr:Succinyl-CoA ligase [ADP-forming] subunit alpha [Candidatus Anoxychlamydiales bacterium]